MTRMGTCGRDEACGRVWGMWQVVGACCGVRWHGVGACH